MFGNFRHIISLLALVLLGGVFYYLATHDNFFTTQRERAAEVDRRTEELRVEIITPLNRLRAVTMDAALFTGQEYKVMQDMSVPLLPPVLARSNPFVTAE